MNPVHCRSMPSGKTRSPRDTSAFRQTRDADSMSLKSLGQHQPDIGLTHEFAGMNPSLFIAHKLYFKTYFGHECNLDIVAYTHHVLHEYT